MSSIRSEIFDLVTPHSSARAEIIERFVAGVKLLTRVLNLPSAALVASSELVCELVIVLTFNYHELAAELDADHEPEKLALHARAVGACAVSARALMAGFPVHRVVVIHEPVGARFFVVFAEHESKVASQRPNVKLLVLGLK